MFVYCSSHYFGHFYKIMNTKGDVTSSPGRPRLYTSLLTTPNPNPLNPQWCVKQWLIKHIVVSTLNLHSNPVSNCGKRLGEPRKLDHLCQGVVTSPSFPSGPNIIQPMFLMLCETLTRLCIVLGKPRVVSLISRQGSFF
jgi:hypothetical protein